jgi:hypothetical protein
MQLSTSLSFPQMLTRWSSILNPFISVPMINGLQIDNIILVANTPNVINHGLSRMPQGWFVVDNISSSVIWRSASFNTKTISLESSANTTLSIWIY